MAEKPSAITGTGTVNDPYIVHNYDEIKWACEDAEAIPEGQTTAIPVYLKLNNNIDCQEYAQDFEWEITCQHALDIDLNNKTIKTFYIVERSYMFIIPSAAANFSLHDGSILNIYGNWFNPSYAIFSYAHNGNNALSITNVSMSINISQFSNTNGCIVYTSTSNTTSKQFTNCAITLEGVLNASCSSLFYGCGLFTCDIMCNVAFKSVNFIPSPNCVLQDCRFQGLIDCSEVTGTWAHGYFGYGTIARNCVFDLEMTIPTTWTKTIDFLSNTTSIYNYGIYNRDKLPENYKFDNTTYIECTTQDMDMRVNPHADVTLQGMGFDVIKG